MRNPQQQHHQQQQQQQQEQQFKDDATSLLYQNLQSCNCCPYGYHIDLDFVRYCESLVGEKPSAGQLLRRDKRRSRKSIEIMLGLDTIYRFWEPTEKVHTVKEVHVETEPESPRVVEKIQNYSSSFYSIYESLISTSTTTSHNTGNVTVVSSSSSVKTIPITPPSIITTAPQQTTTTNNSPETSAFLRDALDDVVSDFERTLERTSTRKNKISDHSDHNLCNGNKINNIPWEQYIDVFDSCVSGNNNKSTTSTIKKDVQSIPSPPTPPPPPPPPPIPSLPQQLLQPPHQSLQEKEDAESIGSNGSELDTQALQIIREQMAKSLNRMRELEEQVKKIPILQKQLNSLKEEKHQLEIQLKREETATKNLLNHVTTVNNMTPQLKSISSPFTPQKISPIALESLGSHIRSSPPPKIIKHDVGIMCIQHKKDASTMIQPQLPTLRSIGTNPLNTSTIKDHLYTNQEVEDLIKASLREYDDRKRALRQRNAVTVGTQMAPTQPSPPPPPQIKHIHVQTTNVEKIIPKMSQSVMAIPMMKDAFVTVCPETRSIGCSDHKITDSLCNKCSIQKRTIGCGTDNEVNKNYLSLKQMDMPPRSLSFSLGEHEKLNIKRKTIGTQYQRSVKNVAIQNTVTMETIGIQNSVINQNKSCQYNVEGISKCTDTEDLILLIHKNTNTDEYKLQQTKPTTPLTPPPSPKVKCIDKYCNTDLIRTRDYGTMPSNVRLVNSSSNTDKVVKKDACCGDIIKPHISIACADNYCDSCKDAIKNLARDFTSSKILSNSTTNKDSPILGGGGGGGVSNNGQNGTKIPRPKTLTSPRTTRKLFIRQNTYTISTPSPSPVAENKIIGASAETKRLSASLDSVNISPTQTTTTTTKSSTSTSTSPSSSASQDPIYITKLTTTTKIPPAKSKEGESLSRSYHEEITSTERKTVTTAPIVSVASTSKQKDGRLVPHGGHGKSSSSSLSSSWIDQKSSYPLKSDDDTTMRTVGTNDGEGDGASSSSRSFKLKQESQEQQKSQKVTSSQHLQNMLLNQLATSTLEPRTKKSPSKEMKAAMKVINDSLQKSTSKSGNLKNASGIVQKEWFQISSTDKANPMDVEDYLDCFEEFSNSLLRYIVNMTDSNGNTAMHYAVSHGNFDVVSILLDSKVCNVNQTNNAGYTCVMLVSLAKLKNSAHRTVVQRLFQMADVNIRAKKHCQTALMLAVSHGNLDMVEMLLNAGADINIQDEDGSTALMCAAEHGRIDIVKHLLSQQDCDSLIQDVDGSTAFKIAWQAGHRDIGLLLYVHEQMLRSKMPNVKSEQRSPATPRHQKAYQMHQQQQKQQQQKQK